MIAPPSSDCGRILVRNSKWRRYEKKQHSTTVFLPGCALSTRDIQPLSTGAGTSDRHHYRDGYGPDRSRYTGGESDGYKYGHPYQTGDRDRCRWVLPLGFSAGRRL